MAFRPQYYHPVIVFIAASLSGCGDGRAHVESVPEATPTSVSTATDGGQPVTSIVEPTGELILTQALALALIGNPELRSARWETRIWEARALQAGVLPNPTLDLDVENIAGSRDYRGGDQAEFTVSLGQVIELGGKRAARLRQARLGGAAAQLEYEGRRLQVVGDVAESFIATVGAQQRVEVLRTIVQMAEATVRIIGDRVAAGQAVVVEAARAELALTDARLAVQRAELELAEARLRLAATWGAASPRFSTAAALADAVAPAPSPDDLAARIAQHPDLLRLQAEIDSQAAQVAMEQAAAVPDVSLRVGYRQFAGDGDHAFVASASVPLPVLDRHHGSIAEAQHRLAQARERRQAAESMLRHELAMAHRRLANAYEVCMRLRRDSVPAADSIHAAVELGYRAGKLGSLDLLEAQRTVAAIRLQSIDADIEYQQSRAVLERLSGGPLPAAMSEPPRRPSPRVPASTPASPSADTPVQESTP